MSIVFIPKIADSFESLKPTVVAVKPKPDTSWTERELTLLVNLKAIGMSYRDIGRKLNRSQDSCSLTMIRNDLKWVYKGIRNQMIDGVMHEQATT